LKNVVLLFAFLMGLMVVLVVQAIKATEVLPTRGKKEDKKR